MAAVPLSKIFDNLFEMPDWKSQLYIDLWHWNTLVHDLDNISYHIEHRLESIQSFKLPACLIGIFSVSGQFLLYLVNSIK
jgi:hypothetical protein